MINEQTTNAINLRCRENLDELKKAVYTVGLLIFDVLANDPTLSEEGRDKLEDALAGLASKVPRLRRLGS